MDGCVRPLPQPPAPADVVRPRGLGGEETRSIHMLLMWCIFLLNAMHTECMAIAETNDAVPYTLQCVCHTSALR
jgi:hypothetical protein